MENKLSPRGRWILRNTKEGKVLHIGFAGSDDEPDVIFSESEKKLKNSVLYGVDIASDKVKRLNRKNTQVADGRKLPFKTNYFDSVVLAEVIEHQTDPMTFFIEAYRVLKPRGVFLVTTPNPFGVFRWLKNFFFSSTLTSKQNLSDYLGFYDHKMFYDPLSLASLLFASGFLGVKWTTKNLSIPYVTKLIGEQNVDIWPFNRLGTYSCFRAIK